MIYLCKSFLDYPKIFDKVTKKYNYEQSQKKHSRTYL
jgi:hypothetical protein